MSITLEMITPHPLSFMGKMAGVCWNSDVNDSKKNVNRAIKCIEADHGRLLEFPEVIFIIDECSARMMRELYTHIGGAPTRLQSSTRYVDESGFEYYVPNSCQDDPDYEHAMEEITKSYQNLLAKGKPKEDAANILPLGMHSKMIWKGNLRTLINFFHKRLCTRALKEIREFTNELKKLIASVDDEWKWIADNLFVPLCEQYKFRNPNLCFCIEDKGCGRHPKIGDLVITTNKKDTNNENQTH